MAQRKLKANCRADVGVLGRAVAATPERLAPALLAEVYAMDLMRTRQLRLRIIFFGLRALRSRSSFHVFFIDFQKRRPDVLRDWIADTAAHILEGRDTEDTDSVGGWSQREIDLFQSRVRLSRLET